MIQEWSDDENMPLIVRKETNKRGMSFIHPSSNREIIISDNTVAIWIFSNVLKGIVFTKSQIKEKLRNKELPIVFMATKEIKKYANYPTALGSASLPDWKLCHIDPIGFNTSKSITELEIDEIKEHFKKYTNLTLADFINQCRLKNALVLLEEDKKETDTVVEIDPGTAFGTGSHHTTKLCIHQLDKYMKKGDRLLDVGCGSGILSIIGLKLGAGFAVGTDIDEHAISATLENIEKNGLTDENMEVFQGNILSDQETKDRVGDEKYDIVLANILADVLVPLSEIIRPHMKKGGLIVMSGIINTKEEEVKDALLRNGFEIVEITYSGEWVAITAK